MKKGFTKTMCIALSLVLCLTSLNAQTERAAPEGMKKPQRTDLQFEPYKGPNSETIITIKTNPWPAYKGTLANPFVSPAIGNSGGSIQALEYIEGIIYAVRWSGGNQFGTFNPTNGAFTTIKANFHSTGCDAASMAYNPVNGLTYVFPWTGPDSDGTRFGTVNLATGDFTTIATWAADGEKSYYAAIDEDGVCYAVRNLSNEFGTIDLSTGNFTVKASLPIGNINFIQDIRFDRETGQLYWMAQTSDDDIFYKIDKVTGALTQISFNDLPGTGFQILTWFPTACEPATNLEVVYNEECSSANLSWTASASATTYNVYRDGAIINETPVEATTFENATVDPFVAHTWSVRAVCEDGNESPSEIKTMEACSSCDPVTISISQEENGVLVSWTDDRVVNVFKGEQIIAPEYTGTSYLDENATEGDCYKVEVICGTITSPMSNVECFVSIKENSKIGFSIAPNPANDKIKITAETNFNSIEIVNFLGQTIFSKNNETNHAVIDVANLTNGVYFIRIVSEHGISTQKFVKQ